MYTATKLLNCSAFEQGAGIQGVNFLVKLYYCAYVPVYALYTTHVSLCAFFSFSHEFHKNCVDPWLKLKHTCPLCKNNITEKSSPSAAPPAEELRPQQHAHSPPTPLSPSINSLISSSDSSSVGGGVQQQQEMTLLTSTSTLTEVPINMEETEETIAPDTQIA